MKTKKQAPTLFATADEAAAKATETKGKVFRASRNGETFYVVARSAARAAGAAFLHTGGKVEPVGLAVDAAAVVAAVNALSDKERAALAAKLKELLK